METNMNTNRCNVGTSLQVGVIGVIEGLGSANYENGNLFQIKNDSDDYVTLEVNLANMPEGEFVETRFEPGWNPEIVRVIKKNTTSGLDLKYGF